jgi:FkbM family methyltransferase
LPEFRGRDRMIAVLLRSVGRFDAEVRGTFGDGLRFEGNPAADGNVMELILQRFARPALAPLLDAALPPGGVFADAGANLGLYTLWAARLVGSAGRVLAFEPMPEVRECLERNVALNGFDNVKIVAAGVGAEPGRVTLYRLPGASGVTSRYMTAQGPPTEVPVTTLDAEFPPGSRPPDLVKIDVEGMELEVLHGAQRLLSADVSPLVVLEANAFYFEAAGISYAALRTFLRENGGQLWALRPEACASSRRIPRRPLNVLAARSDQAEHRRVVERLERVRFARNMNG